MRGDRDDQNAADDHHKGVYQHDLSQDAHLWVNQRTLPGHIPRVQVGHFYLHDPHKLDDQKMVDRAVQNVRNLYRKNVDDQDDLRNEDGLSAEVDRHTKASRCVGGDLSENLYP